MSAQKHPRLTTAGWVAIALAVIILALKMIDDGFFTAPSIVGGDLVYTLVWALLVVSIVLISSGRGAAEMWWKDGRPGLPTVAVAYLICSWLVLTFLPPANDKPPVGAQVFGVLSVALLIVMAILMLTDEPLKEIFSVNTSPGPTVIFLWSVVVVYAVSFIFGVALQAEGLADVICAPKVEEVKVDNKVVTEAKDAVVYNCVETSGWADYLLLIGLPGAAAAVTKKKVDEQDQQDLTPDSHEIKLFGGVQYFVFNLVAMLVVVGGLIRWGRLSDLPDVLISVAGASAIVFGLTERTPAVRVSHGEAVMRIDPVAGVAPDDAEDVDGR